MDALTQEKHLTKALKTLHALDTESIPHVLTAPERSALLGQLGYIQIAIDQWRSAVIHAPRAPWSIQAVLATRKASETIAEALRGA
jgi:hypothetical protein